MSMILLAVFAAASCAVAVLALLRLRRSSDGELVRQGKAALTALGQRLRPTDIVKWNELKRLLAAAGFHGRDAGEIFWGVRWVLLIASVAGAFFLLFSNGASQTNLLVAVALVAMGFMGPQAFLNMRAETLRTNVLRSFPTAVDLLVTCLDAGLGLELALERVGKEIGHTEPVLSRELLVTAGEMDTGVPIAEAMAHFGERVGVDEIDLFCAAVAHGSLLGTSLVPTLREYVAAMRRRRMSELEESAGKRSAKLMLPITLLLVPAAGTLVIGPTMASIIQLFGRLK